MASIDTIADRSSGSEIAGKAYFETSTNKFIVYNGSAWVEFDSDGTGAAFANEYSLSFDGNQGMSAAAHSDFSFGTSDFSYSYWVYPTANNGYRVLIDFRQANGNILPSMYHSGINPSYALYAWTGNSLIANYSSGLTLDQWSHIVYTRSGTTGTIYLNGTSVATGTDNKDYSMNGQPYIGIRPPSVSSYNFAGNIDEIAVFNYALSSTNVSDMYNAPANQPTAISGLSPIAWWRMGDDDSATDGASVASVTDISGNGHTFTQSTASNQPTYSTVVP